MPGRYKVDLGRPMGEQRYWDPEDEGPNQELPAAPAPTAPVPLPNPTPPPVSAAPRPESPQPWTPPSYAGCHRWPHWS